MASDTELCNLSLSHLGIGKEIQDLENEQSQEASACRRFFTSARDATLRDFAWPFATRIVALGLVKENPNSEWGYSYRYPSDCVRIRRILSGVRNDRLITKIPYRILSDATARLVYTDKEDAEIEYTVRVTDPMLFSSDFELGFSYRLAFYLAPRLTKGDPFKLGEQALKFYDAEISRAKAAAYNEEFPDIVPETDLLKDRE
jgi:hypothetical protein